MLQCEGYVYKSSSNLEVLYVGAVLVPPVLLVRPDLVDLPSTLCQPEHEERESAAREVEREAARKKKDSP